MSVQNCLVGLLGFFALAPAAFAQSIKSPMRAKNPFVTALTFAQQHAAPAALQAGNDRRLKSALLVAVSQQPPELAFEQVSEIFEREAFEKLAGPAGKLSLARMEQLLAESVPPSRTQLLENVRAHADLLATQLDLIDEPHQRAADELGAWIASNYHADQPLGVSVICTGNSRRSMLGSSLGNIAADYYGLPNVRFHSGGTAPSAFNSRTIRTLQEIGVQVTDTGKAAQLGKAGDPNPIYDVRWSKAFAAQEFSKVYSHDLNPQRNFAALLVCHEADAACPTVEGAAIRIAAPYFDPKAYDGATIEAAKYAERRDDIGRLMMSALLQARRQLHSKK